MKIYLVWNKGRNECVGFHDKRDADWTAKGGRPPTYLGYPATPTIGEAFRDSYGDEMKKLPQTTVEI